MPILPELEAITAHRNQRVIEKFKRDFPNVTEDAESLFVELMKYLWLSQKLQIDQGKNPEDESLKFLLAIYDDMVNVDNMWHCYILSTQDYHDFCHQFFGRYVHHVPDALDMLPPTPEEFAADLEKFVSYAFDHLGEDTVRTWFGLVL